MKSRRIVVALLVLPFLFSCGGSGSDEQKEFTDVSDTRDVNVSDTQEVFEGTDGTNGLDGTGGGPDLDGVTSDAAVDRVSSDAEKVDCISNPCDGMKRCHWPGRDDPDCEHCSGFGPDCPEKCTARCLKPCFVDGTCDESTQECVDGVAEGTRVCLPDD